MQNRYIKYQTYKKIDICYDTLMKVWICYQMDFSAYTKQELKNYISEEFANKLIISNVENKTGAKLRS